MDEISAVTLFGKWAELGRDEGMETGHSASVQEMISIVQERLPENFTAIDVGCGNGWAVRRLSNLPKCSHSYGVDGSEPMIKKARSIDPDGEYVLGKLPEWTPTKTVDLILSMEFVYYLKEPLRFLQLLYDHWLSPGGTLVLGLDHYLENTQSLTWSESLGVHMATLSIEEWSMGLEDSGFIGVESLQVASKDNWPGTLVLLGTKG
ncbi:MAG: class I SAM-dependent methyltransferase [Candidatus Thalassarchaeaceae archaeon]|nr:class I SAM-dependent methyltransferase [Candidatus Thalassarchaeaceae archaeon]